MTKEEMIKVTNLQIIITCSKCKCFNLKGFSYCKKCLKTLENGESENVIDEA
eukprot:CAMPEP_0170484322 /NCGR_PEP_ID=MMETSP0208-20121228/3817_1 /TAXON_ID=197538 /ORGANISM="Strombidium inclinatum, Strain S3" /LENGTH=51 /DNA_ID=CAMNT_0010757629 /DNA_START=35 /DNA_END=190 /DNA_ORIENTATION=-